MKIYNFIPTMLKEQGDNANPHKHSTSHSRGRSCAYPEPPRAYPGNHLWAFLCTNLLIALCALFLVCGQWEQILLSPLAYASTPASGYSFGSSPSLDRASVSIVRLVVSYSTSTPTATPSPTTPAGGGVPCGTPVTGLGALVGSWSGLPGGTTNFVNWLLTDGSLLNPKGTPCGSGNQHQQLSQVQIFASSAYTSGSSSSLLLQTLQCQATLCSDGTSPEATVCQFFPTCANGVVLASFHTITPQPSIDLAATETTPSFGIELTGSPPLSTPQPDQAPQFLTPVQVNPTQANESGMPMVNTDGQLLNLNTMVGDTGASIRDFVNKQLQLTPPPTTHFNPLKANWDVGITAYYAGNFVLAQIDTRQAGLLNPQFGASRTLWNLATAKANGGTQNQPTTHSNTTSPPEAGIDILGVHIPYLFLSILGIFFLIALLALVSILLIRKEFRHRRELASFEREQVSADHQAAIEAQRIAEMEQAQTQPWLQPTVPHFSPPEPEVPVVPMQLAPLASPPSPALPPPLVPSTSISEQKTLAIVPGISNGQMNAENTVADKNHPIHLAVAACTDPGIKRKHRPNEDSLFAAQGTRTYNSLEQQIGLFVIADGMGGHANGQDASRTAIQTIIDYILPKLTAHEELSNDAPVRLLLEGVQSSNQAVHLRNLEHHGDMGTTITAVLVCGATAFVANVGDSRTYLYRPPEGLKKITHDHSVVASLAEAGIIKPDDIYTHPKRNQIYRSLGEKSTVEVDPFMVQLHPGDKLLLCSDGLWDMVRDPDIEHILSNPVPDPATTGNALIHAALESGGDDNVSVIVVQVDESNNRPADSNSGAGIHVLAKPDTVQMPPI